MLTDYSGVNIGSLVPDADQRRIIFTGSRWTVAPMNRDTVTAGEKTDQPTLNYYAVYFSNSEWMSGSFHFRLFGQAEVYIDGVKKAGSADNKPVEKIVHGDWIPGKHTIIVKTATQEAMYCMLILKPTKPTTAPFRFLSVPATRQEYLRCAQR